MMWTLEELMEKENDTMDSIEFNNNSVERNTLPEIEEHQESAYIAEQEVDDLITYGSKDDSIKNPNYRSFLIEYVRKNNRDKKGVLIAIKHDDNKVVIGWSLCCSLDNFDKYFGQEIAYERGCKRFYDETHFEDIPPSITEKLDIFIDRCKKYFKECEFPKWTI